MATYIELRNLFNSDALRNRVAVACTIWANTTLANSPTDPQKTLAKSVLESPDNYAATILKSLLAEFNGQSVSAIQAASDAQIQAQTDQVLDLFVGL